MKNELIITFKGSYIEVIANGEKDFEYSRKLWQQTVECCKKHNCFKVLGIANTTKPVTLIEGYDHDDLFTKLGINHSYKIAWVELNPDFIENYQFIETILSNRGKPGKVFSNVEEAKTWLLS